MSLRNYVGFSLVVVQHPVTQKFLLVEETDDRGWWLPGGGVDPGERLPLFFGFFFFFFFFFFFCAIFRSSFFEAAIRETLEEAGVQVELVGILAMQHTVLQRYDRMR